jgi:hypothetical protein
MENTKLSAHIYEQYIYRYSHKKIKSTCPRHCMHRWGEYTSTNKIPKNKGIKAPIILHDKQVEIK